MKKLFFILVFLFFLTPFWFACNHTGNSQKSIEQTQEKKFNAATIDFKPENYREDEIVFYNLFSPVEFTYLVTEKTAYYNSLLINPINNITKYNSSDKYAINTGIYGADLSYLWMFNQEQQALSYRAAIQRLSDLLDIPREFVDFTYLMAENHAQEFDSLIDVATKAYASADNFLRQTGRPHAAALILLGGWIETLYIATNLYDQPDQVLLNRIALQRYSLNSIYSLLSKYQNRMEIKEYLVQLKKLKKVYDSHDIHLPPEMLVVDTLAKKIELRSHSDMVMTQEQYKEIQLTTTQIRNTLIQ
ncbi:MAG: hypothetical protein AB7E36_02425 [Salinivirgaceae bacterium]